jgi:hypothetical protein
MAESQFTVYKKAFRIGAAVTHGVCHSPDLIRLNGLFFI